MLGAKGVAHCSSGHSEDRELLHAVERDETNDSDHDTGDSRIGAAAAAVRTAAKKRGRSSDADSYSDGSGSECDGNDVRRGIRRHQNGRPAAKKIRNFRIQARSYAITYPRCGVDRSPFDEKFKLLFRPVSYASAREQHADGGYHMHVFADFGKKYDVRSARHFDLAIDGNTYHPNIQKCRNRKQWLVYISKGEDHSANELSGDIGFDPLQEPLGKRKTRYMDWRWSQDYAAGRALSDPTWPVTLECEGTTYEMHKPDPAIKKRSWWIVAPPNAGKTRWLNRKFKGQRIYCPRSGKYPFEGYEDQDIVVYDDRQGVKFEEFASVLNTWDIPMPIAGEIRYITQNWKIGHTRSIIVLSNKTLEESMEPDDIQRMRKRFIQIVNPVLKALEDIDSDDDMPAAAAAEHYDFVS